MKILIKSEDAKKLTNLSEQMDVTDSGVELGKDLSVDGKIVVNSADDVVDINGKPIAGGGLFVHDMVFILNEETTKQVSVRIVSTKAERYNSIYDFATNAYHWFAIPAYRREYNDASCIPAINFNYFVDYDDDAERIEYTYEDSGVVKADYSTTNFASFDFVDTDVFPL